MGNHAERNLLHAYLDDELDLVRSMDLEDHLAACADCSQQVASYRALRESLQCADLRYRAPEEFLVRISARLHESERPKKERPAVLPNFRVPWWGWACTAAAVVVLAVVLVLNGYKQGERELTRAIVSDHVRSLMATHLTDVLTSDQHTVKPWFSGKLDFSPQVRDLSADGFELVGGRLEYLDGHSAAAIVYQRRKHLINVFTWPSSGSDEEPHPIGQQGFNLIQWKQGGMYYCAISDLNRQELGELVSLLRK